MAQGVKRRGHIHHSILRGNKRMQLKDFMDIKIQHINIFLTVAEMGNLTRASEYLHLSASMLSKNIKIFERELGLQLFIHSKKKLTLTPAGRVLAEDMRRATNLIKNSIEVAHMRQAEQTKPIILGASDICDPEIYLLPLTKHFSSKNARFKYFLEFYSLSSLLQKLLSKEIDIAFPSLFEKETFDRIDGIESEIIARYPLTVDISFSNPMAQKGSLSIADLKEMNFIIPSPFLVPEYENKVLMPLCNKYDYKPKIKRYTDSTSAMIFNLQDENDILLIDCTVKSITGYKRIPLEDTESGILIAWRKDSTVDVLMFVKETIEYWKSEAK
jgi:DNA-binding transcriptional LysR family regulator